VLSAGDLSVTATSSETIESVAFAGSIAVAIGIGGALAGAGVQVTNSFDTETHAYHRGLHRRRSRRHRCPGPLVQPP
jgi:large repetitive protein